MQPHNGLLSLPNSKLTDISNAFEPSSHMKRMGRVIMGMAAGLLRARSISCHLATGQHVTINRCKTCTVSCRRGRVWLTSEDDPQDYEILGGNELSLQCHGKVIVTARSEDTLVDLNWREF